MEPVSIGANSWPCRWMHSTLNYRGSSFPFDHITSKLPTVVDLIHNDTLTDVDLSGFVNDVHQGHTVADRWLSHFVPQPVSQNEGSSTVFCRRFERLRLRLHSNVAILFVFRDTWSLMTEDLLITLSKCCTGRVTFLVFSDVLKFPTTLNIHQFPLGPNRYKEFRDFCDGSGATTLLLHLALVSHSEA